MAKCLLTRVPYCNNGKDKDIGLASRLKGQNLIKIFTNFVKMKTYFTQNIGWLLWMFWICTSRLSLCAIIIRASRGWVVKTPDFGFYRYLAFQTSGLPYSAPLSACSSTLLISSFPFSVVLCTAPLGPWT